MDERPQELRQANRGLLMLDDELSRAVLLNDTDKLISLLEQGVDPNANIYYVTYSGNAYTCLMIAAFNNNYESTVLLLNYRVDVDIITYKSVFTAYMWAKYFFCKKVENLIIETNPHANGRYAIVM